MTIYCTHYECRCERAEELALMSERTGRNDLLHTALTVFDLEVPCRHQPKDETTHEVPYL